MAAGVIGTAVVLDTFSAVVAFPADKAPTSSRLCAKSLVQIATYTIRFVHVRRLIQLYVTNFRKIKE